HAHLRVIPHVGEFLGDGVLVHGDGDPAQGLGGELGRVEPRPVVADDGETVATPETEGGEAEGEVAHLIVILAPGPGLPDAAILFPDGEAVGELARVTQEQAGERRQVRHVGLHWSRPWYLRDRL